MAKIHILLKSGINDSQGAAVGKTLKAIGFENIDAVRIGKYIELDLTSASKNEALAEVEKMCDKLLANTVIEKYSYRIIKRRKDNVKKIRYWFRSCWLRIKSRFDKASI